ncbi:uncharacterized protein DFL_001206 [Arthrobotrys flagrans]|uniref:Uncharacterized protein n=1 Tax=Arthrobotrys flagrans TaxID=97331 RepID=A0A437AGG9_ARTFL|nr:hypothetical protein DFL_001206 [Arthrobotrys flagrans]
MFLTANGSQPFTFEPSSPINDGRYRPIVPLLSSPILGGPTSDTNASELLSQPIVQVHTHNPGNYDARPKASEPTVGEEMFDFLATGGFDSIFHLLPPHIQSINPDELQVPVSLALEDYMQSNFGINVNQTRSQLMTPEFTNNLNMLFQQVQPEVTPQVISEDQPEEVHNQQELVPPGHMTQASSLGTQSTSQAVESLPNPPLPSQPPTIKLHLEKPSYDNINTTTSPPPITTSETPSDKRIPFISPELSHCLDYLFADSKPYLKTQQPKSRLSRSSFSSTSSSSPPSSSSSSLLLPDPDTQTPDTLFSLSERNSLDLPSPPPPRPLNTKASPKSPPKKSPRNKRYSLHIRYKPRTPGSPHQCATFSFNPDNEYIELKLAFNDWMTNTFFSNSDQEFSWNSWELEDTDYHERVPSLEALVQNLPFTWTAFRTTEAAFLLVPKQ